MIRRLKPTAKESLRHKATPCLDAIFDSSIFSKFASVWTFIPADSKRVPDTANILIVVRVVVIEIAIVEVQFAAVIAVTIVDRTTPVVIADERCSCHS